MKKLVFFFTMVMSVCTLSAQTVETMTWDDSTRQYLKYVPAAYNSSTSAPVLFVLHGLGDNMNGLVNVGFQQIADQHGWIVIYPQATVATAQLMGTPMTIGTAWNAGITISYSIFTIPVNAEVDDAGFLMAILDDLIANYRIDRDNVFITGFSLGGFMAHRMAIEHGDRIKAIASVSGTIGNTIREQTPVVPVNVMHIHGTADNTVSYANADMNVQDISTNVGVGAEQTVEFWRNFNRCDNTPQIINYPDTQNDSLVFEQSLYTNGTNNTRVAFIKVTGGDHTWYSTPQNDIDYATEIYNFFASCMTPVNIEENEMQNFSISPNPARNIVNITGKGIREIHIFNAAGEQIISTDSTTINVNHFANGLYLVRVLFENGNSKISDLLISK